MGTKSDLGLSSILLCLDYYPGWSTAAGPDIPERHFAVQLDPLSFVSAGDQKTPGLSLKEQQRGNADSEF